MSGHQKRLSVPKSWPVERKTATFTVKAGAGPHGEDGVPLLVVLRDVLGYVDSKKEARYAINQGSVLVNGTSATDERRPIGMFDILAFEEREEYYRVFPDEGGRLALTPIDADAAGSKLAKVEDKTTVSGGRTQLNLHDGSNLVVDEEAYGAGDSVIVDNETGEVVAHFPYEEGELVTAVRGQHAGEIGRIDEIEVTAGSGANIVHVARVGPEGQRSEDEVEFETVADYVVVIDENFTEGDAPRASETSNSAERSSADHSSGQSPREDGDSGEGGDEQ